MSEFKFLDRGAKVAMLLIPGWASDYRIFAPLNLKANYLIPVKYSPFDFEKGLFYAMEKHALKEVSIIGWSMGAFVASDFISKYKERVCGITLVSVRQSYHKDEIDEIRDYLNRKRNAFLYKFYNDCFSRNERDKLSWFKRELMKAYLKEMDLETLFEGLDYLSARELAPKVLDGLKVRFVHGEEDLIAPIEEARRLKDGLPDAGFVAMKATGHMPFLSDSFTNIFDNENGL